MATNPADPPHGLPSWLAPSPASGPRTCLMLWAAPRSSSQPYLALLARVHGRGRWLVMSPPPIQLRAAPLGASSPRCTLMTCSTVMLVFVMLSHFFGDSLSVFTSVAPPAIHLGSAATCTRSARAGDGAVGASRRLNLSFIKKRGRAPLPNPGVLSQVQRLRCRRANQSLRDFSQYPATKLLHWGEIWAGQGRHTCSAWF